MCVIFLKGMLFSPIICILKIMLPEYCFSPARENSLLSLHCLLQKEKQLGSQFDLARREKSEETSSRSSSARTHNLPNFPLIFVDRMDAHGCLAGIVWVSGGDLLVLSKDWIPLLCSQSKVPPGIMLLLSYLLSVLVSSSILDAPVLFSCTIKCI